MRELSANNRQFLVLLLLTGATFGSAYLVSHAEIGIAALVAAGLGLAIVAFLRTEAAIYLLIVAMLLSPEIGVGAEVKQRAGKGLTLRFDDLLLLIVSTSWFLKSALYKELNLLVHTPVNRSIYLYSAACILSTLLGVQAGNVDPLSGSLFVLKYLEYFFIFWMVINSTHSVRQITRYLFVLFSVAAVVSVVAIAQIPYTGRVTAPFQGVHGEPNTLATYLLFILALALGMTVAVKRYRLPLLGFCGLLLVPFIYTLSRSSYAALVPTIYMLLYLTRRFVLMAGLTIVLLIGLISPSSVLPRAVVHRVQSTFAAEARAPGVALRGRKFDSSTEARLSALTNAIDAFKQRPIFGWGVTGWRFVDSQYLKVLVETGLVGSLVFLYLVYTAFSVGWTALNYFRDREPLFYGLAGGFMAGVAGLMVNCIGTNVFIIVRIMEPFWLVYALIYLLPRVASQQSSGAVEPYALSG